MTYLHCRTWIQVLHWISIPNPMASVYYVEHIHNALTQNQIPIRTQIPNCYCIHFLRRIFIQFSHLAVIKIKEKFAFVFPSAQCQWTLTRRVQVSNDVNCITMIPCIDFVDLEAQEFFLLFSTLVGWPSSNQSVFHHFSDSLSAHNMEPFPVLGLVVETVRIKWHSCVSH